IPLRRGVIHHARTDVMNHASTIEMENILKMVTIITRQSRQIEIIFQSELCDPLNMGEYVRAYCHIHGSDHQRSLSINKETGWGHCFNAVCDATMLVAEWNRETAKRLIHMHYQGSPSASSATHHPPYENK